ncbi:hypothetical protein AB3N61_00435 [Leptospira sp. WS58.C1]|uniref:hypothetical protein n=1 Tax=Leptospira cinconiae TaxID=3235173 RepID=UPI00349EF94C
MSRVLRFKNIEYPKVKIDFGLLLFSFFSVAFVVWIFFRLFPFTIVDDAYIHYRVAENFAKTGLPYYNLNDPVNSTSSPNWTICLSLLSKTGIPITYAAFLLGCIGLFSTIYIFGILLKRQNINASLRYAGLLLTFVWIYDTVLMGMESAAALSCLMFGIYLQERKSKFSLLILCLSVFFRYELAVFLIFFFLFPSPKIPDLKEILIAGLPISALSLWMYFHFGTILPRAGMVKLSVYSISYDHPVLAIFGDYSVAVAYLALFFLVGFILYRIGFKTAPRFVLSAWAFGLALPLIYILGRVFVFRWYTPLFLAPFSFSVIWAFHKIKEVDNKGFVYALFSLSILGVLYQPLPKISKDIYAGLFGLSEYRKLTYNSRIVRYLEIGKYLNQKKPNGTLLAPEIGALGHSFEGEIIDAVGLGSSVSVSYHPLKIPEERSDGTIGAIPPKLVLDTVPDFVVSLPVFAEALLQSEFTEIYNCSQETPFAEETKEILEGEKIWGYDWILVCEKKAG